MDYYIENTYVGLLDSPGYSFMRMSYFRTYLTLDFTPWVGRKNQVKTNMILKIASAPQSILMEQFTFIKSLCR